MWIFFISATFCLIYGGPVTKPARSNKALIATGLVSGVGSIVVPYDLARRQEWWRNHFTDNWIGWNRRTLGINRNSECSVRFRGRNQLLGLEAYWYKEWEEEQQKSPPNSTFSASPPPISWKSPSNAAILYLYGATLCGIQFKLRLKLLNQESISESDPGFWCKSCSTLWITKFKTSVVRGIQTNTTCKEVQRKEVFLVKFALPFSWLVSLA